MRDVLTHTAILGMGLPHSGIFPVSVQTPRGECLVTHSYPDNIIDESRGLKLDVTDCTLYTVTHQNWDRDVTNVGNAEAMLEQALQAISEVTIWSKTKEVAGKLSPFERQVGRTDVKVFIIDDPDHFIAWKNPTFWADRRTARMAVSFMGNMIVTNGPASNPVHPVVRRVMAALDLVNLGFSTESFCKRLCDWLRANPFGLQIPEFPLLKLAEPVFAEIDKTVTDPETPST